MSPTLALFATTPYRTSYPWMYSTLPLTASHFPSTFWPLSFRKIHSLSDFNLILICGCPSPIRMLYYFLQNSRWLVLQNSDWLTAFVVTSGTSCASEISSSLWFLDYPKNVLNSLIQGAKNTVFTRLRQVILSVGQVRIRVYSSKGQAYT